MTILVLFISSMCAACLQLLSRNLFYILVAVMGIITVPAAVAQDVCDQLIDCGIKAVWNFAPTHLDVPANILVQNQNMATSLAVLSMHLQAQIKEKK